MYYQYNKDAARAMRPDGDSYIKNVPQDKQFAPKADTTHRIRIMPPWSSVGVIFKHMKMHYRVGQGQVTFLCPDNFGDECQFCQTHAILKKEYEKFKPDVDSARPANRYWSNIVYMDNKQRGVQVYSYGWTVYKMLYDIQDLGMHGDISDPSGGRDFMLVRTGSGRQARDAVIIVPDATRLEDPKWLDQIFDLDSIFVRPNMDVVNAAFKTQPWKIYTPPAVRKAAESAGSQNEAPVAQSAGAIPPPADSTPEKEVVEQPTSKVADEPKAEPKAEPEEKVDPMAEIDALEKELAAKEAAKKKKK